MQIFLYLKSASLFSRLISSNRLVGSRKAGWSHRSDPLGWPPRRATPSASAPAAAERMVGTWGAVSHHTVDLHIQGVHVPLNLQSQRRSDLSGYSRILKSRQKCFPQPKQWRFSAWLAEGAALPRQSTMTGVPSPPHVRLC